MIRVQQPQDLDTSKVMVVLRLLTRAKTKDVRQWIVLTKEYGSKVYPDYMTANACAERFTLEHGFKPEHVQIISRLATSRAEVEGVRRTWFGAQGVK